MEKFIFSISEIFDKSEKDKSIETNYNCLEKNEVKRYYIGPYQRGYKWKSDTVYDHIPILLFDLYDAFLKSKEKQGLKDYYLQYITVKKTKEHINNCDEDVFEVIDGQQRLTSLTLMFNVLRMCFNDDKEVNIAKDQNDKYLVVYSRYDNQNIFDEVLEMLEDNSLNETDIKEQDKHYMYKASKCFKDFFEILLGEKDTGGKYIDEKKIIFGEFLEFIKANVKIILNKEHEYTSAEQVFANLNANKVALTNAYLIKGLLLTKATRRNGNGYSKKHFKEIMDERAIMGRVWDEIYSWFNCIDVSSFFFATKDNGMEKMLELVYDMYYSGDKDKVSNNDIIDNFKKRFVGNESKPYNTNDYKLFEKFHRAISSEEMAYTCLNLIKHTFKQLKLWYEQPEYYNLLGYIQFTLTDRKEKPEVKQNRFYNNVLGFIKSPSNYELLTDLKKVVLEKIDTNAKKNMGYENWLETYNILLALSVFPEHEDDIDVKKYKFDFYSFSVENWTLEHIFPQNPNIDNFKIESDTDKEWVKDKIEQKKKQKDITEEEKTKLDKTKLKIDNNEAINSNDIDFIFSEILDIHNLGNMALLSDKINPALSNSFFNDKRIKLLKKINEGNFVPKHTIDVFSKMLNPVIVEENNTNVEKKLDNTLTTWTNKDIEVHKHWILKRASAIEITLKG